MRSFISWILIVVGVVMVGGSAYREWEIRNEFPDKTDRRLWIDHKDEMRINCAVLVSGFGLLTGGILMRKD